MKREIWTVVSAVYKGLIIVALFTVALHYTIEYLKRRGIAAANVPPPTAWVPKAPDVGTGTIDAPTWSTNGVLVGRNNPTVTERRSQIWDELAQIQRDITQLTKECYGTGIWSSAKKCQGRTDELADRLNAVTEKWEALNRQQGR